VKARARYIASGLAVSSLAAMATAPPAVATPPFQVIATVNVGVNPFGVTTAPDGNTVWVANSGAFGSNGTTVTVLNTSTYAIESVIGVGHFPEDIAFARAGSQAFVTNDSDGTVSVIDTATRTATQSVDLSALPMTFPSGIVASKDSDKIFVSSVGGQRDTSAENLAFLDNSNPSSITVGGGINLVGSTGRPAMTPDGSLLVVGHDVGAEAPPAVALINPSTDQVVSQLMLNEVGVVPDAAITPDGRFAYVTKFSIDGGIGKVWVIDLASRSTVTTIPMPDRSMYGIGVSPDGRFVFATDFSLAEVSVISTATNQIIANVPVGNLPNDVAFTPDSTKAFVTNEGDTTISVISISG
jgi:YVTN family beta-propeller protein